MVDSGIAPEFTPGKYPHRDRSDNFLADGLVLSGQNTLVFDQIMLGDPLITVANYL